MCLYEYLSCKQCHLSTEPAFDSSGKEGRPSSVLCAEHVACSQSAFVSVATCELNTRAVFNDEAFIGEPVTISASGRSKSTHYSVFQSLHLLILPLLNFELGFFVLGWAYLLDKDVEVLVRSFYPVRGDGEAAIIVVDGKYRGMRTLTLRLIA